MVSDMNVGLQYKLCSWIVNKKRSSWITTILLSPLAPIEKQSSYLFISQSSPLFSSPVCFQSCNLLFCICSCCAWCCRPIFVWPSGQPPYSLPWYNHFHCFSWEVGFFSWCDDTNLICSVSGMLPWCVFCHPLKCNILVSNIVRYGVTHYPCSSIISAKCNLFSPFFWPTITLLRISVLAW